MLRHAALAALAAAVGGLSGCGRPAAPPAPSARVDLEHVRWSEFAGPRLARRARADRVLVMPRRIGPLELTPASELVVSRPRIEVFEEGGDAAGAAQGGAAGAGGASAGGAPAAAGRPPLPGVGLARHVVAATLYEPRFTFVQDGVAVARLEAARARASVRHGDLELRGVRVEQVPAGRRLTADRAVWLATGDALWIEGEYELWDGAASTRGRGLRIDVRLRRPTAP